MKYIYIYALPVNAETLFYTLGYPCATSQQQFTERFRDRKTEWSLSNESLDFGSLVAIDNWEFHAIQTLANLACACDRNGSCNTISARTEMRQTAISENLALSPLEKRLDFLSVLFGK